MIEHVYRRATAARTVTAVMVATDDQRIAQAVERFGGVVCMTSADHPTATDRVAEVARQYPCSIVVNLQGDEPLLDPSVVDATVSLLQRDPTVDMGTAARPIANDAELANPNVVKVVTDRDGCALYFSRAAIPHGRDRSSVQLARAHIGLYVYRRETLLRLASLPPEPLEQIEALEQLRALAHGIRIKVADTAYESIGVDTAEDLERVRKLMTRVRVG